MRRFFIPLATIGFFYGMNLMAQDLTPNAVGAFALPEGDGSWIVRVYTSGGFTGRGVGDFGISSKGKVVCSLEESKCGKSFDVSKVQPLIDRLAGTAPSYYAPPPLGLCNDCISRRMTIIRRDSMGIVHSQSFYWTDLNSEVPRDVINLYNALIDAAALK